MTGLAVVTHMFKLLSKVIPESPESPGKSRNLKDAHKERTFLWEFKFIFRPICQSTCVSFVKYCRTNLRRLQVKGAISQSQSSDRLLWIRLAEGAQGCLILLLP